MPGLNAQNITLMKQGDALSLEAINALVLEQHLRFYKFDKYHTQKSEDDAASKKDAHNTICHAKGRRRGGSRCKSCCRRGLLARDCVNEPANILGPQEFADMALEKLGIKARLLDQKAMEELGMGALGVNQGSVRPPYLAIMEWHGGKRGDAPIAFCG